MKFKHLILSISMITAVAFTACDSRNESSEPEATSSTSIVAPQAGTFDIEFVRKQIILKGQPFEVPMPLSDLPEGWTWEESENSRYASDGVGLAHLYYNSERIITVAIENYFDDAKDDGIIYNLAIETEDCSIDGFTPQKSTKAEVEKKYGKPDKITEYQGVQNYTYGTTNGNSKASGRTNEQRAIFSFLENGNIKQISVTYADLTKEKY